MSIDKAKKIKELLSRGVSEIVDKESLEKKLNSGTKLRIKLGIDPTSPNIHLGRSIPLLKLRDFQELGHQIVFIIGDFTGTIGDTSDKDSERPMLTAEVIKENLQTYQQQVAKIIDVNQAEIHYNSHWLAKLDYQDIAQQANIFSINEFISRDNIARRLKDGKRVSLREILYPLMQGYDSVAIKADVEIGGTDQRFNLLAGRDIQKSYQQSPQDIITNPLIEGLDGRKMSSSYGNTVNLLDTAQELFGKIMSLKDEFIIKYFTLLTRADLAQIKVYEKQLADGENPRNIKLKLATELVRFYHSEKEAQEALTYFQDTFTKKLTPEDLESFKPSSYKLVDILVETKLCSSKSEVRRLIKQSGIKVNEVVAGSADMMIEPGSILQKGKLHFIKIV